MDEKPSKKNLIPNLQKFFVLILRKPREREKKIPSFLAIKKTDERKIVKDEKGGREGKRESERE